MFPGLTQGHTSGVSGQGLGPPSGMSLRSSGPSPSLATCRHSGPSSATAHTVPWAASCRPSPIHPPPGGQQEVFAMQPELLPAARESVPTVAQAPGLSQGQQGASTLLLLPRLSRPGPWAGSLLTGSDQHLLACQTPGRSLPRQAPPPAPRELTTFSTT